MPEEERPKTPDRSHEVVKVDMAIKATVKTYDFGDLLRYFKYNMGAGLIMATLERMVADAREDMDSNSFGTAVKIFAFGMAIFLACLGGYILLNNPNLGGSLQMPNVGLPTPETLRG